MIIGYPDTVVYFPERTHVCVGTVHISVQCTYITVPPRICTDLCQIVGDFSKNTWTYFYLNQTLITVLKRQSQHFSQVMVLVRGVQTRQEKMLT